MATIHATESGGAKARYKKESGFGHIERDILGWDKLGRPLVLCDDRLHVADTAPFAHFPIFVNIIKPDIADIIRETVDKYLGDRGFGGIYDPIYDAVRAELRLRRPRRPQRAQLGFAEDHFGMPLFIRVDVRNARMSHHHNNSAAGTPVVDYLAWNPLTKQVHAVGNVTVEQSALAPVLVRNFLQGTKLMTGVIIRSSDDDTPIFTSIGRPPNHDDAIYAPEDAMRILREAAADRGWIPAPPRSEEQE